MSLIKTSLLNGIAVVVRLGTSLVLNKVLAVHLGPSGYAVIGQFQNLIAMAQAVASGAVNTGVTKYTAEYQNDSAARSRLWRTAAMVSLCGGLVVSGLLLAFQRPLAAWALADRGLASVIVWLAFGLLFMLLNGLLLAILSGLKAVRTFVFANIAGSIVSATVAIGLVTWGGLYGALVALAISQAIACVATAWLFQRQGGFQWRALVGRIDAPIARKLGGFALMSITSALLVPLGQLLIRDGLITELSWADAGLWQALGRISDTHLLLLTTTLSLYFLPRFSEIRSAQELSTEVHKGFRFVLPLVLASAACIYLGRHPLVSALLSPQFLSLTDLVGWQLIGDILKVCSWVFGFALVSHAMTRQMIITEFVFTGLLVTLSLLGAHWDGLRGAVIGYALTYGIYGLTMAFLFYKQLLPRLQQAG